MGVCVHSLSGVQNDYLPRRTELPRKKEIPPPIINCCFLDTHTIVPPPFFAGDVRWCSKWAWHRTSGARLYPTLAPTNLELHDRNRAQRGLRGNESVVARNATLRWGASRGRAW